MWSSVGYVAMRFRSDLSIYRAAAEWQSKADFVCLTERCMLMDFIVALTTHFTWMCVRMYEFNKKNPLISTRKLFAVVLLYAHTWKSIGKHQHLTLDEFNAAHNHIHPFNICCRYFLGLCFFHTTEKSIDSFFTLVVVMLPLSCEIFSGSRWLEKIFSSYNKKC